jgi:hypothetical protein
MKTLDVDVDVPIFANNNTDPGTQIRLFNVRKLSDHTLRVTNTAASVGGSGDGDLLDGYITLSLLCTGNQSIDSSFKRLD